MSHDAFADGSVGHHAFVGADIPLEEVGSYDVSREVISTMTFHVHCNTSQFCSVLLERFAKEVLQQKHPEAKRYSIEPGEDNTFYLTMSQAKHRQILELFAKIHESPFSELLEYQGVTQIAALPPIEVPSVEVRRENTQIAKPAEKSLLSFLPPWLRKRVAL